MPYKVKRNQYPGHKTVRPRHYRDQDNFRQLTEGLLKVARSRPALGHSLFFVYIGYDHLVQQCFHKIVAISSAVYSFIISPPFSLLYTN